MNTLILIYILSNITLLGLTEISYKALSSGLIKKEDYIFGKDKEDF